MAALEASEVWCKVFGAELPPPVRDEQSEVPFDASGGEPKGLFSERLLRTAIARYPSHKSPGADGVPIVLLQALSGSLPFEAQAEKATPPRPSSSPSASRLSPTASPFIPTQPQPPRPPLRPWDRLFGNAPPDPPPPPPPFTFPRLLSSLFRLAAAAGVTPLRWGGATVALILKLKTSDNPTPAQTRPIALLPLFRCLFEILLLPHLRPSPSRPWAALHPNQAGFRSGWSCASSILLVDHHVRSGEQLSAFLNFKSAYDSPSPTVVDRAFRQLGIPPLTRSVVWSLLTSGSSFSLIVNGSPTPSLPRRRGFPQGGPSSPPLFNLFLNSLLHRLNALPDLSAFAYADDIALTARTCTALQHGLAIAAEWADEWEIVWTD
ncbi:hypothetical protein JCM10207_003559 [Rhodosporidiobolus poonsookiae]